MKIEIKSIDELLQIPHLKSSFAKAIIFVTVRPNYYDFGCTQFVKLNILDMDGSDIQDWQVDNLRQFLYNVRDVEIIYICCDAGLSRSPAIAAFVAHYFVEIKRAMEIREKYKFLNEEVYYKFLNHGKVKDENQNNY
jgi:protein-tyrosine phosphatase